MDARQFWNDNAHSWTGALRSNGISSRAITSPALISVLSSLSAMAATPARSIADLGCGEGWLAPHARALGLSYVGYDVSDVLIDLARKAHPADAFHVASFENLNLPPGQCDVIVFNFSLLDRDLAPALAAAARHLTARGHLVIQTLHPCFALDPYADGWQTEDFKTFAAPMRGPMTWFGRTLSSWTTALAAAGFRVLRLEEPLAPATGRPLSLIVVAQSTA